MAKTKRTDWTKAEILHLLETRDEMVERSLKQLYRLQTASEQEAGSTIESNGVGFNGVDAEFMTSLYNNLRKWGSLTEKQLRACRRSLKKYANQLTKIANGQLSL